MKEEEHNCIPELFAVGEMYCVCVCMLERDNQFESVSIGNDCTYHILPVCVYRQRESKNWRHYTFHLWFGLTGETFLCFTI